MGASTSFVLRKHLLVNAFPPLAVQVTVLLADAILIEASLSFLGIGVRPPTPTWGGILSAGRDYVFTGFWWFTVFPGMAIFLAVFSLNVLGDGLRDVIDPTTRLRSSDELADLLQLNHEKGATIMKILISGVCGRVGTNLAHQLMGRGHEVRGLVMPGDPKLYKAEQLGVEIVESDNADDEGLRAAADGVDIVIHQAAQILEGIYPSERMLDINTRSTISLLEGALASSTPVKRFMLASTDQTYNPFVTKGVTFYEDTPQKPADIYALTKLLSEQICQSYMREYGLPVTIMRYSSIVAANEVLGVLSPVLGELFH